MSKLYNINRKLRSYKGKDGHQVQLRVRMNEYSGIRCTLCSGIFNFEYARDDKATIKWFPIHEKITNNWARNCAVSILCELGYTDDRIAKFTGHRDNKMINHYKEVHGKDVKSMIDSVKPGKI